ncbi:MAG: hypothetical protein GY869_01105 [Planctomycetes bacterium]|nr:hypothetical protein [Planctomycetota bacterium]
MATLEFELKDANGIDTEIGDTIEVTFPELSINNRDGAYIDNAIELDYEDLEPYHRPQFIVMAKVLCPPSRGLMLRILSIVDDGGEPENIYKPGQLLQFRRTTLHWRKVIM